ncbi:putative ribonuclease H-like domain-containing protein [Tanacetum coccineum]
MTQKLANGFEFKNKACFVCGSLNHLIKDYNFYENKMVGKYVLNNEGKATCQREVRPVWNNAQRVNHQNKLTYPHPRRNFVPSSVITNPGKVPVNTTKQSFSRAAVSNSIARDVNIVASRPTVNGAKPSSNVFHNWVFFLATKDETPKILKNFITGIENQIDHKVKAIKCNNRTEFKNRIMNEFCEMKGIRREFSVARTPQQNGVAERKNRTLIKASRNMLADSKLPTTFWAEVVNTACYVQNRVPKSSEDEVADDARKKNEVLDPAKEGDMNGQGEAANTNSTNRLNIVSSSVNTDAQGNNTYKIFTPVSAVGSSYDNHGRSISIIAATLPNGDLPTDPLMLELEDTIDLQDTIYREPKKVFQALADPSWAEAVQEELLQNKKDKRGIVVRNKARLVAQGYTQEEGIKYDEVFAAVARIEAIRLFLAYASFMGFIVYQMDVKSAFLYGTIEEEVYVCQPLGFKDPQFPNKVYKVEKALYGLHHAPRAWYETLSTYLLQNEFRRGIIDKTLFIKKDNGDILLVQVYVDDIIFSQDKYVADILKKFDFTTVKAASTPIETNKVLHKDEEAGDVDVHLYRSMIGLLMFQVTPKTSHLHAVKRIFRYLKGQPKLGLWYPRDSPFDLEAFSDSDYARASLGKRLISWKCKKQTIVANSTTDAEYVAATNCCGQIIEFLTRSSIHYALTASPVISTTFVEQFWTSAKSQTINNVRYINAKVAGKPVTISEASIRSDLRFNDVDGIYSLNNQVIFDAIKLMGYEGDLTVLTFYKALFSPKWKFLFHTLNHCLSSKSTSWDQIPTNIATKKFVMYPRFISIFLSNQLTNVPVPLDHFPIHALSNKVFSFMVKKGKHFSGKVTPLFPNMLVQPTEDEGEGSERPSEPQPTSSPSHSRETHVEPQSDPSPGPSPTILILDPILEGSGGNLGSQSSSDKSLSGSEGGLTLQSVYDLYLSLCTQFTDQAAEIKYLKAQVKKLKKQARTFILHHKVWLRTVKIKNQHKKKVLKTSKRRSVFKQGRKTVKSSKGAPTVPTNTEWDDLDMDIDDTMDYTLAQDEGKTDKVDEKGESTAQQQSTDRQDEGTDMPKVSTARTKLSTDKVEEGTAEPEPRESTSSAAQTTPTPTPTTFGDDETIAQVLLNMSQAKAVSKEKEKGVEIRNAENAERPRTTSTRSVLTLKPLPKIDPNDKGKKRIEEDEESDTESEEITEAKKKFDQIAHDEEVARKMQEEWEAEEERKRLTEEEATKTALSNEYDFIQARIEADRLLAERVQEAEREQFTVEERAKFLHDTIATQRRILAQQRSEAIRNKPPTKNQFRNQMMTYLKHVGNKKHADLKTKSFDEIKALYEKVKRFDDSFITIGSTEDERKIKEMNEGASDPDKKKKIVKEDVSAKVPAKQDVAEQGTKKRKGGHMKMIARKRKRPQPDVDSDDEHRKCLKIVTFEGTIDSEIMETKSFISKLDKVSSPEGDYLVVYRVNGNFRAFNYLMEVLHIFDRQDIFHLYDLVMKQYSESILEGIELILCGDLKIMMESLIEVTDQVIHMLVERKYPLSKELLQRMLDFGLEVEVESTAALDLIRTVVPTKYCTFVGLPLGSATPARTRDSGPELSFDIPASLKCMSGLARASSAKIQYPSRSSPLAASLELVMSELSDDSIGVYHRMFDFSGVRIPFSTFMLSIINRCKLSESLLWSGFSKLFKVIGFPLQSTRASPDYMSWRHPSSAIDDPKPPAGSYSQYDVRRLSAHVVKLRDIPKGVLVLSGLSRAWKSQTRDLILKDSSGNVMGSYEFLYLPEWTRAEVQEEPHHDIRLTLQRLPFYYTHHAAAKFVISDPTLEDLSIGTPSAKVIAKAEASKKAKGLPFCDDDEDACVEIPLVTPICSATVIPTGGNRGGGSVPPLLKILAPEGKAIMTDATDASFGRAGRSRSSADGVTGSCEFIREEWDAPHQPTLIILTKEVFKDPAVCKTVVDQFPTPGDMVQVKALTNDQLITKISVLYCLMMSHRGELLARYQGLLKTYHEYVQSADSRLRSLQERCAAFQGLKSQVFDFQKQVANLNDKLSSFDAAFINAKDKGKERKKKIKSLTKNLDQLNVKVARLSSALNQATVLEDKKDVEILQLKSSPPEFASFFRGGFQSLVRKFLASDEFSRVQDELISLAASAGLAEASPLVAMTDYPFLKKVSDSKESTVTPVSSSLEFPSNDVPFSYAAALGHNEEWVNAMVDMLDNEMADGADNDKLGVFSCRVFLIQLVKMLEKGNGSPSSSSAAEEAVASPFRV